MTEVERAQKIEELQARLEQDISEVERKTIQILLKFFGVETE